MTWQLQSSVMARYPPTGSRVSLSVYKGKGDALERGNYRGLKMTEQVNAQSPGEDCGWPYQTSGVNR